jgi:hypothetical protein
LAHPHLPAKAGVARERAVRVGDAGCMLVALTVLVKGVQVLWCCAVPDVDWHVVAGNART